MNMNKMIRLSMFSLSSICLPAISISIAANTTIIQDNAETITYTMSLNQEHKLATSQDFSNGSNVVLTDQNKTQINMSYVNAKNYEFGLLTLGQGGYFQTKDQINGLIKIAYSFSSPLTLKHAFNQINDEEYADEVTLSTEGEYTFTNNSPLYLRLENNNEAEVNVNYITLYYSCASVYEDFTITYHTNGGSIADHEPKTHFCEQTGTNAFYYTTSTHQFFYGEVNNNKNTIFIMPNNVEQSMLWAYKLGLKIHNLTNEYEVNQYVAAGTSNQDVLTNSDYWIYWHENYTTINPDFFDRPNRQRKVNIGDVIRFSQSLSGSSEGALIGAKIYTKENASIYEITYNNLATVPEVIKSGDVFKYWKAQNNKDALSLYQYGNSTTLYAYYNSDYQKGLAVSYLYTNTLKTSDNVLKNSDIVICAFAHPNADGTFSDMADTMYRARTIKNTIKEKGYGTKVLFSIQNPTPIQEPTQMSIISASAELRATFVNNIVTAIRDNGIDGVDVDWEFPKAEEATNYTLLMKDVYEGVKGLNSSLLVMSAVGVDTWKRYDVTNSQNYVDYFNVMTYDLQSTGTVQHCSALYKYTFGDKNTMSSYSSCEKAIGYYIAAGVPTNKLLLGIPYYGRVYSGVSGTGSTGTTIGIGSSYTSLAIMHFSAIIETYNNGNSGYVYCYDDQAQVPYLVNEAEGKVIVYDNELSIAKKAEYAKNLGLAGLFSWQDGLDYEDTLANGMFDSVKGWTK